MELNELAENIVAVCEGRGYTIKRVIETKKSLETYGNDTPLVLLFPMTQRMDRQSGKQDIFVRMQFLLKSSLQDDSDELFNHLDYIEGEANSLLRSIYEHEDIDYTPTDERWTPIVNDNALVASGYEVSFSILGIDC